MIDGFIKCFLFDVSIIVTRLYAYKLNNKTVKVLKLLNKFKLNLVWFEFILRGRT